MNLCESWIPEVNREGPVWWSPAIAFGELLSQLENTLVVRWFLKQWVLRTGGEGSMHVLERTKHERDIDCERRLIDWRERKQWAIKNHWALRMWFKTQSELLHFWIAGASGIFLGHTVRHPDLDRLPGGGGGGGWPSTPTLSQLTLPIWGSLGSISWFKANRSNKPPRTKLTEKNKFFQSETVLYSSLSFLSRIMLGKVEHNFIEKSIVIGTLHDPWQRTLMTGSLEICKLIDFCCLHPHIQAQWGAPLPTTYPGSHWFCHSLLLFMG